jgi:hypothetical protein
MRRPVLVAPIGDVGLTVVPFTISNRPVGSNRAVKFLTP